MQLDTTSIAFFICFFDETKKSLVANLANIKIYLLYVYMYYILVTSISFDGISDNRLEIDDISR